MKGTPIVPFEKIEKNIFHNKNKVSVVFNRVMSIVYENDIFPIFPYGTVEIHHIN